VIGFMMWTWISVVILLAGAELNAEMEHQTAHDTTTGAPQPMGTRGATMADTLGRGRAAGYADAPRASDPSRHLSRHPADLPPEPDGGARPQSKLGTILGFAIPAAVLVGVAALEVRDRTKPRRPRPEKIASVPYRLKTEQAARRLRAASDWMGRGRRFLETPAGRDLVGRALRSATRAFRR
jgi:hypothetical protein